MTGELLAVVRRLDEGLEQVEAVYRAAMSSLSTQSLVFIGQTGAGKTYNFKRSLEYLVDTTQKVEEKIFTSKEYSKALSKHTLEQKQI